MSTPRGNKDYRARLRAEARERGVTIKTVIDERRGGKFLAGRRPEKSDAQIERESAEWICRMDATA